MQKEIRKNTSVTRTSIRTSWAYEQKTVILKYFKRYLDINSLPGKKEIEKFMDIQTGWPENRTWRNVKDLLYNNLKKQIKDST